MAFRRCVTARAKLLYQQQRVAAPFPHIHRDDNDHQNLTYIHNTNPKDIAISNFFQRRLYGSGANLGDFHRSSRNLFGDRRFATIPVVCGPVFVRNMSSIGESVAERSEIVTDIATVLGDEAVGGAVASQVANEVAIAISVGDSSSPVAAFQYLVDYVHCYTGFNWWASIVVTTVLIRLIQLPLRINSRKHNEKSKLLKLRLKEIEEEMNSRDMSPAAVAEAEAQRKELHKEYRLKSITSWTGSLVGGSIFCCFFLALKNMAENVPSFKEGGALWFTDLTTPDSIYLFPVLTALSFMVTVEKASAQVNMEQRYVKSAKRILEVCSALTIPLTATFPKAIFCYMLTASLFSHASKSVLRNPEVKMLLGFPPKPVEQPSADKKPTAEAAKKDAEAAQEKHQSVSSSSSSPSVSYLSFNPRITSLETEVKEIKEGNKNATNIGCSFKGSSFQEKQRSVSSSSSYLSFGERITSLEREVKEIKEGKKNATDIDCSFKGSSFQEKQQSVSSSSSSSSFFSLSRILSSLSSYFSLLDQRITSLEREVKEIKEARKNAQK